MHHIFDQIFLDWNRNFIKINLYKTEKNPLFLRIFNYFTVSKIDY